MSGLKEEGEDTAIREWSKQGGTQESAWKPSFPTTQTHSTNSGHPPINQPLTMPLLTTCEAATWTEATCLSTRPCLMVPGLSLHRGPSTSLFPEAHPVSTGCLVQVPSLP